MNAVPFQGIESPTTVLALKYHKGVQVLWQNGGLREA